jgi:trypsin
MVTSLSIEFIRSWTLPPKQHSYTYTYIDQIAKLWYFYIGQHCYITGWGTLQSGGSTPAVLQEAQVPIVTPQECKTSYGSSKITDRMLCAGFSQGGTDACQGDSGGKT